MNRTLVADFCLLLVAFVWGTTFVLVQNAIALIEPFTFNGIRFFIAALILGAWLLLFERNQLAFLNKKALLSGTFLGIWLFLGYAFQTAGLLYTTSSKAGFITGLSVVLVPLFSLLLMKQSIGVNAAAGISIATLGLFLLTSGDIAGINFGDILTFFCALAFAFHIIFTGKYSEHFPALLLSIIQISTVALLSTVCSFIFENWKQTISIGTLLSREVFGAILITSVFATAIAFFAQTNFQKDTTATRVALIFAMEPVFAAFAGYTWAGDRLGVSAVFGCLFIFAGMIFSEWPSDKLSFFRKTKKTINS